MKILLLDLNRILEPKTRKLEKWARPRPVVYVARCQGVPVYIGCTTRGIRRRIQEHAAKPSLFGLSLTSYPEYDWTIELQFPTEYHEHRVSRLERQLIRRYRPQCNTKFNAGSRVGTPPLFNQRIWYRAEYFGFMHEWYAVPYNSDAHALHRYINGEMTEQPENLIIRATDPYKYSYPNTPEWNQEATQKFAAELEAKRAQKAAERRAHAEPHHWRALAARAEAAREQQRREGPTFEQLMAMSPEEFEQFLGIPKVAQ